MKHLVFVLAIMTLPGVALAQGPIEVPEAARALGARDDDGSHKVHAKLVLDHTRAPAGAKVRVGVALEIAPDWHTYWRNSGDAGLATSLSFSASGATFSPMTWPAPTVYVQSGLITTYGYAERVLHASSFEIPKGPPGPLTLTAEVDYLACKVKCIPGSATLTRTIEVAPEAARSAEFPLFDAFERALPQAPSARGMRAVVRLSQDVVRPEDVVRAEVALETCPSGQDCPRVEVDAPLEPAHAFIPDLSPNITWKVTDVQAHPEAPGLLVSLEGRAKRDAPTQPNHLRGVLKLTRAGKDALPLWIEHEVKMAARDAPVTQIPLTQAAPAAAAEEAPGEEPAPPLSLWYVLGLALVGGLLLNVMPCVFPVLTLKVASLAEVAHKGRRETFLHGVAYTAGILATMGALALVVVGLKLTGNQAGWGFQFQSPYFLAGLSAVLVVFSLNLFGVFEVGIPMGSRLGGVTTPESGLQRSFMEGLLCVLLSTPCSAPFMGTAVGFALASDAFTILLVFTMLGLGLASPFLVLTAWPAWAKWLPKPGDWLLWLKQFLGFTLLGTTLWLLWLLGVSFGADGMTRGLIFLLGLSLSAWLYGLVQYREGTRKWVVLALAMGIAVAVSVQTLQFSPATAVESTEDGWVPFDEAAIQTHVKAGRPVFVDFTADWCITCKVNERTVLATDTVRQAVAKHKVVMMKADWTRRDDRIRAVLARHGKAGVPMYLLYAPERPTTPRVLPEVLTPGMVVDALAKAASKR